MKQKYLTFIYRCKYFETYSYNIVIKPNIFLTSRQQCVQTLLTDARTKFSLDNYNNEGASARRRRAISPDGCPLLF